MSTVGDIAFDQIANVHHGWGGDADDGHTCVCGAPIVGADLDATFRQHVVDAINAAVAAQ